MRGAAGRSFCPDMSGVDVARRIKSVRATRTLPIIQISAVRTSTLDAVAGLQGGADAYLVDPVDPSLLVATVRSMARARAAELEVGRGCGGVGNDVRRDLRRRVSGRRGRDHRTCESRRRAHRRSGQGSVARQTARGHSSATAAGRSGRRAGAVAGGVGAGGRRADVFADLRRAARRPAGRKGP